MSILRPVNSKANIKQTSNTDMPANVSQNILNRYEADSTLAQTVINMSFSVDQANKDAFLLYVDGKLLREGAANDYTFTNVASDNTSSQVTLNAALPAGLNIIAIKAGTKIEAELQTDTRFVAAYDYLDKAFQGFVSQNAQLVATTTTGTPTTGTFYSSIPNRTSIPDFTADLKARMGIERIPIQQIGQVQTEFGPNGEQVYSVLNNQSNQIRFIGSGWTNAAFGAVGDVGGGLGAKTTTSGDYVEITYYGTGLNILIDASYAMNLTYQINGGTAATLTTTTYSSVLTPVGPPIGRNYAGNQILAVTSNQTLGLYTVRINQATTTLFKVEGVEILNESSLVKTNGGIAYIQGKKITPAASSVAYNTTFTNIYGTAGSRGGRVLQYLDQSGNIKKDIQYTNTASALTSSADHTNEEIVRPYFPKEFGAGRSDDFSTVTASGTSRAFTLDDGTTTLVSSGASFTSNPAGIEGMNLSGTNGSFGVFTFVGTGLDLVLFDTASGGADTYTYQIDGATAVTWPYSTGSTAVRTQKIVSGLPYGTHTFRINRVTAATYNIAVVKFIVYQPKKPVLPTGCIELADYNIMADYAINNAASNDLTAVAQGVLVKQNIREQLYTGTWAASINTASPNGFMSGWQMQSTVVGDSVTNTFFGTGVVFSGQIGSSGTTKFSIYIDGVLQTSSATILVGLTFASNVYTNSGVSTMYRVLINGLSLGKHTIQIVATTSSTTLMVGEFWTITPIHSTKTNLYTEYQNTLPIGSQGISDNRKTSAIKEALPAQKFRGQFQQLPTNYSSNSVNGSTYLPMQGVFVNLTSQGSMFEFVFYSYARDTLSSGPRYALFLDGVIITPDEIIYSGGATTDMYIGLTCMVYVPPGNHTVQAAWHNNSAGASTMTAFKTYLSAKEL